MDDLIFQSPIMSSHNGDIGWLEGKKQLCIHCQGVLKMIRRLVPFSTLPN